MKCNKYACKYDGIYSDIFIFPRRKLLELCFCFFSKQTSVPALCSALGLRVPPCRRHAGQCPGRASRHCLLAARRVTRLTGLAGGPPCRALPCRIPRPIRPRRFNAQRLRRSRGGAAERVQCTTCSAGRRQNDAFPPPLQNWRCSRHACLFAVQSQGCKKH